MKIKPPPLEKRQELGRDSGREAACETRKQMEAAGFTFQRLMEKLDDLLNAQKPISCIRGKEADGGTVDFIDVPDNQAQIKALDMAFTLRDDYPCKKLKADVNHSGSIMAAVAGYLSKEKK